VYRSYKEAVTLPSAGGAHPRLAVPEGKGKGCPVTDERSKHTTPNGELSRDPAELVGPLGASADAAPSASAAPTFVGVEEEHVDPLLERGIHAIELQVEDDNHEAMAFYRRAGLLAHSRIPMSKRLSAR
jgi:hypothetical protein